MPTSLTAALTFVRRQRLRFAVYGLLLLAVLAAAGGLAYARHRSDASLADSASRLAAAERQDFYLKKYATFRTAVLAYGQRGVDVAPYTIQVAAVRTTVLQGNYAAADSAMKSLTATLDGLAAQALESQKAAQAAAAAAQLAEENKATVSGTVTFAGKPLAGANVSITLAPDFKQDLTTATDGVYSFRVIAGSYSLSASEAGYVTAVSTVDLAAKQVLAKDIAVTKPAPTPSATPKPTAKPTSAPTTAPVSQSNGSGSYQKEAVSTSRGSFTINLLTIDLTKTKVITASAAGGDCTNACATKSLQTYISDNQAYAGMNGTYFCPPDYSDCAGKTNSFYWKLWNTPSGREINTSNGLGEQDPFLAFSSDGTARYFTTWQAFHTSGFNASAGISCKPRMIENGSIVLSNADMDDKQETTKSSRGGIGIKGFTLYAVIAQSATVPDLAAVMQSLGVSYAINLDGGGSSAMAFGGSYKVGPGRSLPNAIVFAAR